MSFDRRTRSSRRLLTPIVVAAALAMPSGAVVAAPSDHFTDHRLDLTCSSLETVELSATLLLSASDRVETFAELNVYVAPAAPPLDPPTFIAEFADLSLGSDDSSLAGAIGLIRFETGEPAGPAILDASLVRSGPAETIEQRSSGGNRKSRWTETRQPMSVGGSLTVPGANSDVVLSLDGCSAAVVDLATFNNAPSSAVASDAVLGLRCLWDSADLFVRFEAAVDAGLSFADIAVITPQSAFTGSDDDATFTRTVLTTTLPLDLADHGLNGGGIASAAASFIPGEVVTWVVTEQDSRTKVRAVPLSVAGVLNISLDDGTAIELAMSDEACEAFDRNLREVKLSRHGGNRQPPSNDTPEGAAPIAVGRVANAHTGGAAFEGEATTECLLLEDGFTLNLAHSVWYFFIGTGHPVTIDTSGSDFDTVVAVYTDGASEVAEVACGDDRALEPFGVSRQAKLTFDTEAGVVYLVQAGGFVEESGHMRLRIEAAA